MSFDWAVAPGVLQRSGYCPILLADTKGKVPQLNHRTLRGSLHPAWESGDGALLHQLPKRQGKFTDHLQVGTGLTQARDELRLLGSEGWPGLLQPRGNLAHRGGLEGAGSPQKVRALLGSEALEPLAQPRHVALQHAWGPGIPLRSD